MDTRFFTNNEKEPPRFVAYIVRVHPSHRCQTIAGALAARDHWWPLVAVGGRWWPLVAIGDHCGPKEHSGSPPRFLEGTLCVAFILEVPHSGWTKSTSWANHLPVADFGTLCVWDSDPHNVGVPFDLLLSQPAKHCDTYCSLVRACCGCKRSMQVLFQPPK